MKLIRKDRSAEDWYFGKPSNPCKRGNLKYQWWWFILFHSTCLQSNNLLLWNRWNFSVGQNEIAYVTRKPAAAYDLVQDQKQSNDNSRKVVYPSGADENSSKLTGSQMQCSYENDACYETLDESCEDCDVHSECLLFNYKWNLCGAQIHSGISGV